MAAIPQFSDPTLDAVDRAMEEREASRRFTRDYLGASSIGEECSRALWYKFRWAGAERLDAASIKRIQDGFHGEDVQAERLRLVDGILLMTIDPETGKQIGIEDHGGHFKGHLDGAISGLLQAPKAWHVWECKINGEDVLADLEKCKAEHGEKNALRAWNPVYYAQAQIYMHYTGMERHYLTAAAPGGRRTVSVRTDYDIAEAIKYVEKARWIIFAANPPERISDKPDFFICNMCEHQPYCQGEALPARNCRTCLHSTPNPEGGWGCEKHKRGLDSVLQKEGCPEQRYIPSIAPGEQFDAADDASWISYRMPNGSIWHDEGPETKTQPLFASRKPIEAAQ